MSDDEIIKVNDQNLGLNKKLEDVNFKEAFDSQKLKKAEEHIEKNQELFLDATRDDMQELKEIFDRISDDSIRYEVGRMQELAFSIKSRAATAGFPLASSVAKSLFEFCERKVQELNTEKFNVAKLHMSALNEILSEEFDCADEAKSSKLIDGLHKLTDKH